MYTSNLTEKGNSSYSFESQEDAEQSARILDDNNCTGCVMSRNCVNCTDCVNCTGCGSCADCTDCVSCRNCRSCTNCTNCDGCTRSVNYRSQFNQKEKLK